MRLLVLVLAALQAVSAVWQIRSVTDCSNKVTFKQLHLGPCNETDSQTFLYDGADDKQGRKY